MDRVALISPRISFQKNDFLGSGVVYWPTELAILSSFMIEKDIKVDFIDLFGEDPANLEEKKDYFLQGKNIKHKKFEEIIKLNDFFFLFALSYMSHSEVLEICSHIKKIKPCSKIAILENSQAVTAYSIEMVKKDFFASGADILICGEPFSNLDEIIAFLKGNLSISPKNVIAPTDMKKVERIKEQLDFYPIPNWDKVNYKNYWNIPYSHGPKTKKYFPIFTSRGCPYPCDFCVVPEITSRKWKGNSPEHVVEEMLTLKKKYGVNNFQIEDLNPTVQEKRWLEIAKLLIDKKANINYFIVSGTKAETISINNVKLFAESGCKYISISPESGSPRLMKIIGKKFNYDHGINLVKECKKYNITTQACFLVGHPDENNDDFELSKKYLKSLLKAGLDETAIFIVSSFAGSKLYQSNSIKMSNSENLISFTPVGRDGYDVLEKRRKILIRYFLFYKILNLSLLVSFFRSLFSTPKTKMENLPKRVFYIFFNILKNKIT